MSQVRDVIVIGGSAGAVGALLRLVGGLPSALSARVFVTVHIPPTSASVLPALLARAGALPAKHPVDGEVTRRGVIYVAPPDFHLLVVRGGVRVERGPPENGCRPAVDPLFRSAAASYGARVVGVVVSGNLRDGSTGAEEIHAAGGMIVVQAPDDSQYPGMPRSTLASVPAATVLPLDSIAGHLAQLVMGSIHSAPSRGSANLTTVVATRPARSSSIPTPGKSVGASDDRVR
ncbi:MAG: chemotaxis protein CheB [Gemmatimonadaceae bacterium]